MPIVKMPDGQMVDMPDNPSTEQLAALKQRFPEVEAPENPIWHALKVGGSALLRGAGQLPALLAGGSAADYNEKAFGARSFVQPTEGKFDAQAPQRMVEELGPKPRTPGEKYLASGMEGIGGALTMPIGGLGKAVVQGGMSGLGAEAGGQMNPESPFTRILGGLAAGGVTGIVQSILPQRGNVAREIMKDVRPQDFDAAVEGMKRNAALGVPTNLSQTMRNPSNIDSAVDLLANNRNGVNVTAQLRNQPKQAELEMEAALSGMPGEIGTERAIANASQEGATGAIKAAKKARTEAVASLYAQAGEISKYTRKDLLDAVSEMVTTPGVSLDMINKAQLFGRTLKAHPSTGLPVDNAADVKAVIDGVLTKNIDGQLNPASPKTQGELMALKSKLFDILGESSPELKQANALYRKITEERINPLKQSVVGDIAGRGYKLDKSAAQTKAFDIFNKGTSPGATQSDILDFERETRKQDPTVYQNAFKSWVASKIDDATTATSARDNVYVSENFVKAFGYPGKSSREWKTMEDGLAGLARSTGQAEKPMVDGFGQLMRLNAELAIRPASVSGVTGSELGAMAKDSPLTRMGSTSFIAPLRQPALAVARLVGASVLKDADKWLTTPEGAAMLAQLGKQEYMSPGWVKTLQTLAATTAASQGNE